MSFAYLFQLHLVFPGGIGISPLEVACAMSTAFEAFGRSKPHCVKKIKVVVYEPSIITMFRKNIVEVKGKELYFRFVSPPRNSYIVFGDFKTALILF